MRIIQLVIILLTTLSIQGQGQICGNFTPAKNFKWLVAYKLTPGGQNYVADTTIKDGKFELKLPITAASGIYRLVYALPQDEFYLDVMYTKQEDIKLNFNIAEGTSFIQSNENIWHDEYFNKIEAAQEQLIALFDTGNISNAKYLAAASKINEIQNKYEEKYQKSIAHTLIKANRSYLPKSFEPLEVLLQQQKQHYFDAIDLENDLLQSSVFLNDKLKNYVYSAVPSNIQSREGYTKEVNKNINTIAAKIKHTFLPFQVKTFHELWKVANGNTLPNIADNIFKNHLKAAALHSGNRNLVNTIEQETRLKIGAVSPEISWVEDGKTKLLSNMKGAENYLIIFWSSTCSHCLKEIPVLYKEVQNYTGLKVLAIGLEDEQENWKKVSATLPNFTHGIALKKWDSKYVSLFAIEKTPTYFILDSKKRIIDKPDNDKEVITFLKNKRH